MNISKTFARFAGVGASVGFALSAIGYKALAAADATLVNDAASAATGLQENGQAVASELVIPVLITAAAFGLVALGVRYIRKLMGR